MEMVHIALDNYDDIFSDFDIGPYETRLISADFLSELKRKTKNREVGKIILTLPGKIREKAKEQLIIKRLKEFFRRKEHEKEKKFKESLIFGLLLITVAVLLIIFLSVTKLFFDTIFHDYLIFPSWYISWKGLDKFFHSMKILKEKDYFRKLQRATIHFDDEEKYLTVQESKELTEQEKSHVGMH